MSQNQDKSPVVISITPGTMITGVLLVLGVATLFLLKDLVLVILTAIIISSAIEPGVLYFMRYGAHRIVAVLIVYILVVGAFLGGVYFFLPPVINEASLIMAKLPQNLESFGVPGITDGASLITTAKEAGVTNLLGGSFSDVFASVKEIQQAFTDSSGGLIRTISTVFGGLLSFFLIFVLSFYFAMQETGVDDFIRLVAPVKHQAYALDLWRRSHMKIGLWMQGQILLSVLIGVLVYLGLEIVYQGFGVTGSRYSLVLAIIAAAFELIPVFGSFIAAVPAIIIAYVDGGATLALLVLGLYVIVNQFQSNLIYPLVVKKIVGVPPLLVILALIAGAQLAGFIGVIIAVPFAAALQEFVSDIQRRKQRELEGMNTPA